MLELNVLQTQWLMMALAGGIVVTLAIIMSYFAIWQPRHGRAAAPRAHHGPAWSRWFADIPWILIFVFVAGILFIIAYTIDKSIHPPNW